MGGSSDLVKLSAFRTASVYIYPSVLHFLFVWFLFVFHLSIRIWDYVLSTFYRHLLHLVWVKLFSFRFHQGTQIIVRDWLLDLLDICKWRQHLGELAAQFLLPKALKLKVNYNKLMSLYPNSMICWECPFLESLWEKISSCPQSSEIKIWQLKDVWGF